jgi:hypothetical protein
MSTVCFKSCFEEPFNIVIRQKAQPGVAGLELRVGECARLRAIVGDARSHRVSRATVNEHGIVMAVKAGKRGH